MNALATFSWPAPPGEKAQPLWNGHGFSCDGRLSRLLTYSPTTSHWSDDLTSLHESEAGRDHPIDLASRRLAVASMQKLDAAFPVILDVGCSSGFVIEDLQKALPQAGLIGADYLPGPLEGLAKRMPDIPLLQFDLRRCPLPDGSIDGITCLNVLEHIDDHVAALTEIHRILKPRGIAHIEVPAGPTLYDIYDEHLLHQRRYRLTDLVAMSRKAGFKILKKTHLGFFVFPAFFLAKRRNQKNAPLSPEKRASLVAQQIRQTRKNPLLSTLMSIETTLGRFSTYPCGIRCVVVLRKN